MSRLGRLIRPFRYIKKYTWDDWETPALHFPGYNYLGPGSRDFSKQPIDGLDRAAYEHDLAYLRYVNPYASWNPADEEFLRAVRAFRPRSGSQMAVKLVVEHIFQVKKLTLGGVRPIEKPVREYFYEEVRLRSMLQPESFKRQRLLPPESFDKEEEMQDMEIDYKGHITPFTTVKERYIASNDHGVKILHDGRRRYQRQQRPPLSYRQREYVKRMIQDDNRATSYWNGTYTGDIQCLAGECSYSSVPHWTDSHIETIHGILQTELGTTLSDFQPIELSDYQTKITFYNDYNNGVYVDIWDVRPVNPIADGLNIQTILASLAADYVGTNQNWSNTNPLQNPWQMPDMALLFRFLKHRLIYLAPGETFVTTIFTKKKTATLQTFTPGDTDLGIPQITYHPDYTKICMFRIYGQVASDPSNTGAKFGRSIAGVRWLVEQTMKYRIGLDDGDREWRTTTGSTIKATETLKTHEPQQPLADVAQNN